jgi:hypothetical protein
MDYRFLAAGVVAAVLGYLSGSIVFADAPRLAGDPALAQAANDRAALVTEIAAPLPPAAELPALPKLPPTPKLPDVNAILEAAVPKVRVVVVRRPTQTTPVRHITRKRKPAQPESEHEHEQEQEGSDHEGGDD